MNEELMYEVGTKVANFLEKEFPDLPEDGGQLMQDLTFEIMDQLEK